MSGLGWRRSLCVCVYATEIISSTSAAVAAKGNMNCVYETGKCRGGRTKDVSAKIQCLDERPFSEIACNNEYEKCTFNVEWNKGEAE